MSERKTKLSGIKVRPTVEVLRNELVKCVIERGRNGRFIRVVGERLDVIRFAGVLPKPADERRAPSPPLQKARDRLAGGGIQ